MQTFHATAPELASTGTLPDGAAAGAAPRPKLDLSKVTPPERLEEVRIEATTIDGICGVY